MIELEYGYSGSGITMNDNARTSLACLVWACEREGLVLRPLEVTDEQISRLEDFMAQSPYARWTAALFERSDDSPHYRVWRNELLELSNYSLLITDGVVEFKKCGRGLEFSHLPNALAASKELKEFFMACARVLFESPKPPPPPPRISWGEKLLSALFRG